MPNKKNKQKKYILPQQKFNVVESKSFIDSEKLKNFDAKKSIEDLQKSFEKQKTEELEKEKKESKRLEGLKCPLCKSKKKRHVQKTTNNGVIGYGFISNVVDEYYYCLDCGIMYKDINNNK